jgi:hypothetical protein
MYAMLHALDAVLAVIGEQKARLVLSNIVGTTCPGYSSPTFLTRPIFAIVSSV